MNDSRNQLMLRVNFFTRVSESELEELNAIVFDRLRPILSTEDFYYTIKKHDKLEDQEFFHCVLEVECMREVQPHDLNNTLLMLTNFFENPANHFSEEELDKLNFYTSTLLFEKDWLRDNVEHIVTFMSQIISINQVTNRIGDANYARMEEELDQTIEEVQYLLEENAKLKAIICMKREESDIIPKLLRELYTATGNDDLFHEIVNGELVTVH